MSFRRHMQLEVDLMANHHFDPRFYLEIDCKCSINVTLV